MIERHLREWVTWHNEHRVHRSIAGRAPADLEQGENDGERRREVVWIAACSKGEDLFGQKHMQVYPLKRAS